MERIPGRKEHAFMTDEIKDGDLDKLKAHAYAELEKSRPAEGTPALSDVPTPWAVLCRKHGQQFLTEDEYGRQLCRPAARWTCPICREDAVWDDDTYEAALLSGEW